MGLTTPPYNAIWNRTNYHRNIRQKYYHCERTILWLISQEYHTKNAFIMHSAFRAKQRTWIGLTAFTNYCIFAIAISKMKWTQNALKKCNLSTRLSEDFRTINSRHFMSIISKWRHTLVNKITNQLHWWKLIHAFTSSPEMNPSIRLIYTSSSAKHQDKIHSNWTGDRAAASRRLRWGNKCRKLQITN